MTAVNTYSNALPPFFEKVQTNISDPMKLRDPFKSNLTAIKPEKKDAEKMLKNGRYSNVPTLGKVSLDRIVIVGTLLGETRLATAKIVSVPGMIPGPESPSYIIKEGMMLGQNNAEVRAIVHGGIVLVEKVRNVYEQDEYIETIIPVTRPVLAQKNTVNTSPPAPSPTPEPEQQRSLPPSSPPSSPPTK